MYAYTAKYDIDAALRERNFEYLADLIRHAAELKPDIREHLAAQVLGLIKRQIKLPRHPPAKQSTHKARREIALRVIEVEERAQRKKLSQSVADVAAEFHCSIGKVWSCLRDHREDERIRDAIRDEKEWFDAMADLAHEARWEAAIESLRESAGSDREFTDEEIEEEAKLLDEAGRDYEPY